MKPPSAYRTASGGCGEVDTVGASSAVAFVQLGPAAQPALQPQLQATVAMEARRAS